MGNELVPTIEAEFVDLPVERAEDGRGLSAIPQADSDYHLIGRWVEQSSSDRTSGKYRAEAARLD